MRKAWNTRRTSRGDPNQFCPDFRQGGADGSAKLLSGGKGFARERISELHGPGFVQLSGWEQSFHERTWIYLLQQSAENGLAALRIHAHVERTFVLHGKTADRIVNLHRGNTEVRDDDIRAGGSLGGGQHLWQTGKVGAVRRKSIRAETQFTQASFGLG